MVLVQRIGAVEYFEKEIMISSDKIMGTSNGSLLKADGGERGRCVTPDATAEYGGMVVYDGEEEGIRNAY